MENPPGYGGDQAPPQEAVGEVWRKVLRAAARAGRTDATVQILLAMRETGVRVTAGEYGQALRVMSSLDAEAG